VKSPRAGSRAVGFALLLIASIGFALALWWRSGAPSAPPATAVAPAVAAEYVGGSACADCHTPQRDAWKGSHHDLAMQIANGETVLGDFNGATFRYAGITSTFTRRDGRFYVRTDGPDGTLADYEITYTFGVTPLQQYLIPFPGGRLQALSIAWDTRPKAEGGQRWFHLYPDEAVTASDPLHWTGLQQNWNFTCAECHSTNLKKGYDAQANIYQTTWSELNVSCEACHGPGSGHIAWAKARAGDVERNSPTKGLMLALDERRGIGWQPDADTGNSTRSAPRQTTREVDTCARCHGRSSRIADVYVHGRSPLDTHRPALLDDGIYWADGQMRGEVYNWGSFVQSRMNQKGVTCSDCHDPHSLQLRAPGNAVCAQCHLANKYDEVAHTRHQRGTPAAACASCHMPVTTYMQVDPRHDHSFRVPRPDLSVGFGVPNACSSCHTKESAQWAADAIAGWTGRPPRTDGQVVAALQAGSAGAPGAGAALAAVIDDTTRPAIIRASALRRLASVLTPATLRPVSAALKDPDAVVRMAAVEALSESDPALKAQQLGPLLADPVRSVRMEAASALAGEAERRLAAADRPRFEAALAEYVRSLQYNADRPEGRLSLGNLHRTRGAADAAVVEYRGALSLDPSFTEAYVNLADVYRGTGNEQQAETTLREGLARAPGAAALHYALGLSLVRQQRRAEATLALEKASELEPGTPRYAYTYAVALHGWGQPQRAVEQLKAALSRHPYDRDLLTGLATYAAAAGDRDAAQQYAQRLSELNR
jgi:tetratricopeptide (TPR) repeat protein